MKPKNKLTTLIRCLVLASSMLFNTAHAIPIHVTASADIESIPVVTNYIPVGTTIHADVSFDASGTWGAYDFTNVSGSILWNDGVEREMIVQSASAGGAGWTGFFQILFHGDSPQINGSDLWGVEIGFFISENPFSTTVDIGELLAGAELYGFELHVIGAGQVWARDNVSGVVSASVPAPSSLALLGVTPFVLLVSHRRRATRRCGKSLPKRVQN